MEYVLPLEEPILGVIAALLDYSQETKDYQEKIDTEKKNILAEKALNSNFSENRWEYYASNT